MTIVNDSIDKADQALVALVKRGGRAMKILVGALIIATLALSVAVGLLIYNNQGETSRINTAVNKAIAIEQVRLEKQCDFYKLIGELPVMSTTSKAGVSLVADGRNVYIGLGCSPQLTLPSAELLDLSKKYSVTVLG